MYCFYILCYIVALNLCYEVSAGIEGPKAGLNVTAFMRHRKRRSLIYQGAGTLKFVIGPSMPIRLGDPIEWRSMVNSYNLHGGHYALPTLPLYPWDKWEDTFARSLRKIYKYYENNEYSHSLQPDSSRLFVYTLLEKLLNNQNADKGRACLLRAICQNAQVHQHVGMLAEVLNVILTPGKEDLNPAYKEAYLSGAAGVDCLKLYADCPKGANLLDQYLDYV